MSSMCQCYKWYLCWKLTFLTQDGDAHSVQLSRYLNTSSASHTVQLPLFVPSEKKIGYQYEYSIHAVLWARGSVAHIIGSW